MTEKKQKKVIRESARAPRDEAANEFLEEQEEQAGDQRPRPARCVADEEEIGDGMSERGSAGPGRSPL